jgi:hypothetical protein
MWAAINNNIVPFAGFVATLVPLCLVLQLMRVSYQRRNLNLQLSSKLLDQFFEAAEKVLSDPATPEIIKDYVDVSEELIGDRQLARHVAVNIMTHCQTSSNPEKLYRAIADLKESRPDLIHNFYLAINSAITASLLRWKETAPAAIALYVDQQQQAEPARVIKSVEYMSAGGAKGRYCPA